MPMMAMGSSAAAVCVVVAAVPVADPARDSRRNATSASGLG